MFRRLWAMKRTSKVWKILYAKEMPQISYQQKATYYREGNGKKLLYVLHGYGQLAKFFIRKFKDLGDQYTIIAPEGQHYFYLRGTSGRVGACWMTKENREQDIENYINYLNAVHAEISSEHDWQEVSILGFSQGVAKAFRWLAEGNLTPE